MKLRLLTTSIAMGASLASAAPLRPRDRFPITTDQVAAKLIATFAQKGLALDAAQIVLPAAVSATEEVPALEVRSVEKLGPLKGSPAESTSSAVKIACSSARVCLPFYAVVTVPSSREDSGASKAQLDLGNDARRTEVVVKSGAHLTMLVNNGTMHIQMAVVSLQNGSLNQQIKVRSADRKQTFSVQVLDANTVKGAL